MTKCSDLDYFLVLHTRQCTAVFPERTKCLRTNYEHWLDETAVNQTGCMVLRQGPSQQPATACRSHA